MNIGTPSIDSGSNDMIASIGSASADGWALSAAGTLVFLVSRSQAERDGYRWFEWR